MADKRKSNRQKRAEANAEKYNLKKYDLKAGESYEQAYKRLAKVADQRLVRIERLAQQEGYRNIQKFAYNKALYDIRRFAGEKATRFNTKMPTDKRELHAKVRAMLAFLNSPTSTKQGIDRTYQQRANTINERYGTTFTWEQLAQYFTSGTADKLSKLFGSEQVLKLIGEFQKDPDILLQELNESTKNEIESDDDMINSKIYEYLEGHKVKGSDLAKLKKKAEDAKKKKAKQSETKGIGPGKARNDGRHKIKRKRI